MKRESLHKITYRRSHMLRVRFVLVALMIVGGMVLGSRSVVWADSSAVAYYKGKPAAGGIYNSSSNKFTLSDDACDGKGVEIVWDGTYHETNKKGCKTKKSFKPNHVEHGKKLHMASLRDTNADHKQVLPSDYRPWLTPGVDVNDLKARQIPGRNGLGEQGRLDGWASTDVAEALAEASVIADAAQSTPPRLGPPAVLLPHPAYCASRLRPSKNRHPPRRA